MPPVWAHWYLHASTGKWRHVHIHVSALPAVALNALQHALQQRLRHQLIEARGHDAKGEALRTQAADVGVGLPSCARPARLPPGPLLQCLTSSAGRPSLQFSCRNTPSSIGSS
jgi:hypothetical protein